MQSGRRSLEFQRNITGSIFRVKEWVKLVAQVKQAASKDMLYPTKFGISTTKDNMDYIFYIRYIIS
jgi:hypothetical protein